MHYDKTILASTIINVNQENPSGITFGRDTLSYFVSPLFIKPMEKLFDLNIPTLSCGSGKERNILPGITGDINKLSEANRLIVKDLMISDFEYRLGTEITETTTFAEFESALLMLVNKLQPQ